ncbi:MAG: hypothetical protein JWN70_6753 [Planctomycetaceae bacterium]|nr:hypothetical protein [Planctomycetaceae bacterium]
MPMRRLKWICLALVTYGVGSVVHAAPPAAKPVYSNKPRFRIPYHFDADEMQKLGAREIRLYVSTDLGIRWQPSQAVPPQPGKFNFQAPGEGEYWFCVRTLDSRNQLHPADEAVHPGLQVIVDTTSPQLSLNLRQVAPGRVQLSWNARDEHLDASKLRLEYVQAGGTNWQTVPVVPKAADSTEWNVPQGGMVAVRGAVADLAGNMGQAETRVQIAPGNGNGQTGPDFRDPVAGNDLPPDSQAVTKPRGQIPSAAQEQLNRDSWDQPGGLSDFPSGRQELAARDQAQRPLSGFASMQQGAGIPGFRSQETSFGQPPRRDAAARVVNQRQFQIGYRIEEIGPSGISSVELFITQDNGASWYRYGEDADKRSPFVVSVPREGAYGFTLIVRSGVGLASDPPQPGERPSIVVNVDETAPRVQLLPVEQGRGQALNKLLIRWMVQDENLAERPISLWYGASPNGPWQPISGGLDNTGSHVWTMAAGIAPRIYFRIEARDNAGNVQRLDTTEPLLIDLSKPSARILDVETTADSGLQLPN